MWYDSLNKKYYIGSHCGSEFDNYAHSSSFMPKFIREYPRAGFKRRILARGSIKEMIELEDRLLKNRYERCWGRYWNERPAATDNVGIGNPNFKHGKAVGWKQNKTVQKANDKDRNSTYHANNKEKELARMRADYYRKKRNYDKCKEEFDLWQSLKKPSS